MPSRKTALALATSIVVFGACGGPVPQPSDEARTSSTPHAMPTATPIYAGPAEFDPAEAFPDYRFTRTDRFWVQLEHLEVEDSTISVGVVPKQIETDLAAEVADLQEGFAEEDRASHQTGVFESEVLGPVHWIAVTVDNGGREFVEISLFAHHPRDGTLVTARAEFPIASANVDDKRDELLGMTEIVAPSL